ncbi:hypothetical protein EVJ58_g9776 [Rhodofomes roseus]|uniref:Uncharacterized protein n=1 Tax=Rhodofomes roseus TaxID=34475 RepID=A0A4Y9XWC0_9APHY|nr:hypothetical protein EVJ58_g9776 [Rhodofomes roseus]
MHSELTLDDMHKSTLGNVHSTMLSNLCGGMMPGNVHGTTNNVHDVLTLSNMHRAMLSSPHGLTFNNPHNLTFNGPHGLTFDDPYNLVFDDLHGPTLDSVNMSNDGHDLILGSNTNYYTSSLTGALSFSSGLG